MPTQLKKAIVIGASGLIGKQLVHFLLDDSTFTKVTIFVRKALPILNEKLQQIVLDFKQLEQYSADFDGSVLFLCIGTTRKKTPNLEEYRAIDYGITLRAANLAKASGIEEVHLISAIGASSNSTIFYNKLKGEIEEDLIKIGFTSTYIYQPSMLIGARDESRPVELIFQKLMPFFDLLMLGSLKKYHSVSKEKLAKAMLKHHLSAKKGIHVMTYSDF
ncbi:MAG: NAD-dependent epimerase/dehydratase family protein [Flavobacteriales bacterium]|nr:NAD-dependent epimerase/dehydratase family protein [Flavobacteriales bacterium]